MDDGDDDDDNYDEQGYLTSHHGKSSFSAMLNI
jgi:hypothetical protein